LDVFDDVDIDVAFAVEFEFDLAVGYAVPK